MGTTDLSRCERCGRAVEPEQLWTLNLNLPADGHVERSVCVICAAEVRRCLLAPPGGSQNAAAEVETSEGERARASRIGWFLIRGFVYGGIAAGVFALVTWLSS